MEIREAAALRQQRRIKQAIQFLHKDSADLLPLDGLNKLGTSKEWVRQAILQNVCHHEAYFCDGHSSNSELAYLLALAKIRRPSWIIIFITCKLTLGLGYPASATSLKVEFSFFNCLPKQYMMSTSKRVKMRHLIQGRSISCTMRINRSRLSWGRFP